MFQFPVSRTLYMCSLAVKQTVTVFSSRRGQHTDLLCWLLPPPQPANRTGSSEAPTARRPGRSWTCSWPAGRPLTPRLINNEILNNKYSRILLRRGHTRDSISLIIIITIIWISGWRLTTNEETGKQLWISTFPEWRNVLMISKLILNTLPAETAASWACCGAPPCSEAGTLRTADKASTSPAPRGWRGWAPWSRGSGRWRGPLQVTNIPTDWWLKGLQMSWATNHYFFSFIRVLSCVCESEGETLVQS